MVEREITSEYDTSLTNSDGQKIHRVWELIIFDQAFVFERYGSICGWAELKLKKKGLEVYRITKPWCKERRTEYFFDQQERVYWRDQFSFVEYLAYLSKNERFPTTEEFVRKGLNLNVERLYRESFQKILVMEVLPCS